jgi:hypothetical protein
VRAARCGHTAFLLISPQLGLLARLAPTKGALQSERDHFLAPSLLFVCQMKFLSSGFEAAKTMLQFRTEAAR